MTPFVRTGANREFPQIALGGSAKEPCNPPSGASELVRSRACGFHERLPWMLSNSIRSICFEEKTYFLFLEAMETSDPPSAAPRVPNHPQDGGDPASVVGLGSRAQAHDRELQHAVKPAERLANDERRDSPRIALSAQLVVVWRDAAQLAETHTILDYGLGGFRLRSNRTVPVGRIGRAVSMLPERAAVDLDVVVVWSVVRPDGLCDFGVRFLGS